MRSCSSWSLDWLEWVSKQEQRGAWRTCLQSAAQTQHTVRLEGGSARRRPLMGMSECRYACIAAW